MRTFAILSILLFLTAPILSSAQTTDSILVGSWHLDETTVGVTFDSSGYHYLATTIGTTVIPGCKGAGRSFNGTSDYISITDYFGQLNFPPSQSFRIDLSFKTSQSDGVILRKGLAPLPGYTVALLEGHLVGMIGNRSDSQSPDTLVSIASTQRVNDNVWHRVSFIRNQSAHTLMLYIDGVEAADPVAENIGFALSNDRPLTIGRWENWQYPQYFQGELDEIRILRFFTVVSDTQALWHFDEPTPATALDASPYANPITVYGTTVVPGVSGNARHFGGNAEYMWMSQPKPGCFNFGVSTSFTVEAWFKTASANDQPIVMQGNYETYTQPAWQIKTYGGYAAAFMGNPNSSVSGDPYLLLFSKNRVDDNRWRLLTFVRDREQRKLFLYVDGVLVSDPVEDTYPYAIASTRPLTIGRWEDSGNPYYFNGSIDEIAVYRGARHPSSVLFPHLLLSSDAVNFGKVLVGDSASATIQLSNTGFQDTLRITEMDIQPPFSCHLPTPLAIPPRTSVHLAIKYRPTTGGHDTSSFIMATNDPDRPSAVIHLQGAGIGVTDQPTIMSITDIPDDQGHKVRVVWLRSVYDGLDHSQTLTGYDIWRRVDDGPSGVPSGHPGSSLLQGSLWDFVGTIPPVAFNEYSYVAPTLYDSTLLHGMHQSIFMVSARTSTEVVYFSEPDSGYSVDNLIPHQPGNFMGSTAGGVHLQWDPPGDPDILLYEVYRGTQSNFIPSPDKKIATTYTNSYLDASAPKGLVYYCVAAVDSAGNRSAYSPTLGLIVTEVNTQGNQLPDRFSLYQSYPNPFNPSTQIRFDVPSHCRVVIRIHDTLGREVATLVDEEKPAGRYAVVWNAGNRSSGVYWYSMTAGGFHRTERMLLLK